MIERIEREAENARENKPARIIAKMNALVEPKIIQALYCASQAGVKIDLIIRGTCCLRPGIKGLSDNIQVRSIVGRFLEHTRVFYFLNADDPEVYCSSADWMNRNMFRRVEACFPLENPQLRNQVIEDLELYLKDNCQAWTLDAGGCYQRLQPAKGEEAVSAQVELLKGLAEKA
jgi:polyphosphate kinase